MKKHLKFAALVTLVMLGACGKYGELEPKTGSKAIPAAYGQEEAAAADELLAPSAQARPGRSVELLRRSERREDDPFDLPPGSAPKVEASNADGGDGEEQPAPEPKSPGDPE